MKQKAKGKPKPLSRTIDLDAIAERILNRLLEGLDSTGVSLRQELKAHVAALHSCLSAAYELVPQVEHTKPDYLQVGECVTYDSNYGTLSFGNNNTLKLPFKTMQGYYGNQCLDLSQSASDTVRAVAQALSGRQDDQLEAGRYRYAILLYKVDEKPGEPAK